MTNQGNFTIGIIGAGTMGTGIAQVTASAGYPTILFDSQPAYVDRARDTLKSTFSMLVTKGKMTQPQADNALANLHFGSAITQFSPCGLIIEAVIEDLDVKRDIFKSIERLVGPECILATNTSSLSITSVAAATEKPERVLGIHFFNPAPVMPLVEVIPGIATDLDLVYKVTAMLRSWGKSPVIAEDTPGFIVNRIARPFYGEALRIYEEHWEGIPAGEAGFGAIDKAMRDAGFKMGPFELMDMIGNDVNYRVTETVWHQFFYDPRYKPSLTQKRLFEAGRFGRKSGRGYYNYAEGALRPVYELSEATSKKIAARIITMLINEAVDAVHYKIATADDIETAMTKGVNYPKGLLKWCDEIGAGVVLKTLSKLHDDYMEDRYRPSVLLREMAGSGKKFFSKK